MISRVCPYCGERIRGLRDASSSTTLLLHEWQRHRDELVAGALKARDVTADVALQVGPQDERRQA